MAEKIPIPKLIQGLREIGLYDMYTVRKLNLLASSLPGAEEISTKERAVTEHVFGSLTESVERNGRILFRALAPAGGSSPGGKLDCEVKDFLGYGNAGPVYSVIVEGKEYALKVYSGRDLVAMQELHGTFGLNGILSALDMEDRETLLSDLGKEVLSRKPKGVYGRCKRIVKVHNIGCERDYVYVLMDMLAVDPINKVDPARIGGDVQDLVSWAVDCAVGLCHLHTEERRLHLNIRPEAFIKKVTRPEKRLPKYTFFNYPAKYPRLDGAPSAGTEFIMVDHLDNSVHVNDREAKGLGTVGSWVFMPPETIMQLLKQLRDDYKIYVEGGKLVDEVKPIRLKRSQMDDIWALGVTLYQFMAGGKPPFSEPTNLTDMVNAILLTKFDFSPVDPRLRDLVSSMLEKDASRRFKRLMEGCPAEMASRRVLSEAVLFKLEQIALDSTT